MFWKTALKKSELPSIATTTIRFSLLHSFVLFSPCFYLLLNLLNSAFKISGQRSKSNPHSARELNPGNNLIKLYKKNDLTIEDNTALMCFITNVLPTVRGSAHMSLLFSFHASRNVRLMRSSASIWLLNGTISL